MAKIIRMIFFFTVMIAIVALFTSAGLMAQDRPLECVAGSYTITPATDVDFPYLSTCADNEACYVWTYYVTGGDQAKINKVHFFIPSFPPNVIEVADIPDYADQWAERGVGGVSTDFGYQNYTGIVVTVPPVAGNSPQTTVQFATKSVSTYGMVSPVVSTGKAQLDCVASDTDDQGPVGGIVGPGFATSGIVLAPVSEDINVAGGSMCVRVKRHPVTGCIQNFAFCDGEDMTSTQTRPSWLTEDIADFGDPNNRLCRGGIIATKGSPVAYWGWTPPNNYTCIGLYDPANGCYHYGCSTYPPPPYPPWICPQ